MKHDVKGHSLIAYLQGQKIRVSVSSRKTVQRGAAFTNEFMEDMYHSAFRFAEKEDNPHNLMCAKLATLTLFYGPLYDVIKNRLDTDISRRPYISSRFFELVEQHFKDKLDLSFFCRH